MHKNFTDTKNRRYIISRAVVGNGIIVDVSKHFTQIIELNAEEKWVRVQPAFIRDELNMFLKPYGLFFAPNIDS